MPWYWQFGTYPVWEYHCSIIHPTIVKISSESKATLTTNFAARSAGSPRQAFAAASDDKVSQIPSEAITSLPPASES